MVSCKLIYW